MTLKPLHDWAVIRPSQALEVSAGGLFIPESAKTKPQEGVVEAIGPGAFEEEKGRKKGEKKERRFVPTVVKPGDLVLYERYAGQTTTIGGEERVLVRERDILGVFPDGRPVREQPQPLMLPPSTSALGSTALMTTSVLAPASAPSVEKQARKTAKKTAKKPAKKTTKKPAKKAAKKSAKKSAVKKKVATAKKTSSRAAGTKKKAKKAKKK